MLTCAFSCAASDWYNAMDLPASTLTKVERTADNAWPRAGSGIVESVVSAASASSAAKDSIAAATSSCGRLCGSRASTQSTAAWGSISAQARSAWGRVFSPVIGSKASMAAIADERIRSRPSLGRLAQQAATFLPIRFGDGVCQPPRLRRIPAFKEPALPQHRIRQRRGRTHESRRRFALRVRDVVPHALDVLNIHSLRVARTGRRVPESPLPRLGGQAAPGWRRGRRRR